MPLSHESGEDAIITIAANLADVDSFVIVFQDCSTLDIGKSVKLPLPMIERESWLSLPKSCLVHFRNTAPDKPRLFSRIECRKPPIAKPHPGDSAIESDQDLHSCKNGGPDHFRWPSHRCVVWRLNTRKRSVAVLRMLEPKRDATVTDHQEFCAVRSSVAEQHFPLLGGNAR